MLCNIQTRSLIIIICTYIYENKAKMYLLLTCKFMYELINNVLFYECVDVSKLKNVLFNSYLPKKRLFDNVQNIIIDNNYRKQSALIIKYLPPKLKKLEIIKSNVRIDHTISMPKTLEILSFKTDYPLNNNFFNCGLKKLMIDANFIFSPDLLPSGLIYLKIYGDPDIVSFPNLKCLILNIKRYDIICPLPASIKHLGLYTKKSKIINLDKSIIPKNMVRFEFDNNAWCDVLNEFPKLTKVKMEENENIQSIPSSVISISNGYHVNHEYNLNMFFPMFRFLKHIKPTVTTLGINNFDDYISIPETVSVLKIYNFYINTNGNTYFLTMIKNIKELTIKKLYSSYNNKLRIPLTIQKLTIQYVDRHLLRTDIYANCDVRYKY